MTLQTLCARLAAAMAEQRNINVASHCSKLFTIATNDRGKGQYQRQCQPALVRWSLELAEQPHRF